MFTSEFCKIICYEFKIIRAEITIQQPGEQVFNSLLFSFLKASYLAKESLYVKNVFFSAQFFMTVSYTQEGW